MRFSASRSPLACRGPLHKYNVPINLSFRGHKYLHPLDIACTNGAPKIFMLSPAVCCEWPGSVIDVRSE